MRELGYHITNTLLWVLFLPAVAAVTAVVAGPFLYQFGV